MRQSNGYLLMFTGILTIVCALVLAGLSIALKKPTEENEKLDKRSKILGAATDIEGLSNEEINTIYENDIVSFVVDQDGNVLEDVSVDDIDIEKQYKDKDFTKLPVYKYRDDVDPKKFRSYIMPMYGNGLWDNIWGYVSIGNDFNTIKGAIFAHKAETPGLGAKIAEKDYQDRFIGKKIFNESGKLKSVKMEKGEGNKYPDNPHSVDGMAGASMTGAGLNDMLKKYFGYYEPFMTKEKEQLAGNGNTGGSSSKAFSIDRNKKD